LKNRTNRGLNVKPSFFPKFGTKNYYICQFFYKNRTNSGIWGI